MIFAAVALAAFFPLLRQANHGVLMSSFVFIPTIFGLLFASTWLLVSDLFEHAPKTVAAHSFSRIGASSLAGGMVGGFISKALAPHLNPEWLILLAALGILVVAGVVIKTHRVFRLLASTNATKQITKVKSLSVFSNRYFRILLLLSMAGGLAGLFIEFQFYAPATSLGNDLRGNVNFFANYYTLIYLGALLVELFVAPKIQNKLGLSGGLVILPFVLLGGSAFAVVATTLSRSLLKVTEGSLKASIHRPLWEQAFMPLQSPQRSIGKILVDGIAPRVAEGIGAIMLLLWAMRFDTGDKQIDLSSMFHDTQWTIWVILFSVLVWLFLIQKLHREMGRLGSLQDSETDCVRFPDQCPTTTELGKGIQ
jgi:ATP/ADP translocase